MCGVYIYIYMSFLLIAKYVHTYSTAYSVHPLADQQSEDVVDTLVLGGGVHLGRETATTVAQMYQTIATCTKT